MIMSDPIVIFEIIGNLLMSWWLGQTQKFCGSHIAPNSSNSHIFENLLEALHWR